MKSFSMAYLVHGQLKKENMGEKVSVLVLIARDEKAGILIPFFSDFHAKWCKHYFEKHMTLSSRKRKKYRTPKEKEKSKRSIQLSILSTCPYGWLDTLQINSLKLSKPVSPTRKAHQNMKSRQCPIAERTKSKKCTIGPLPPSLLPSLLLARKDKYQVSTIFLD